MNSGKSAEYFVENGLVDMDFNLIEGKGLSLKLDMADEKLPVHADTESLRQIFDNLLSNACRYTAAGSQIEVHAHRNVQREVFGMRFHGR